MAKQNLSALLGRLDEDQEVPTPLAAPDVQPTPRVKPGEQRAKPTPARGVDGGEPFYLSFERKETRLRPDQYAELTAHARRLNKAKGPGGERITENTLIRIAIDLLMPQLNQAGGRDEAEIRKSVSL